MSESDKKIIERIDEKLNRVISLRPVSSSLVNKLREQFALEMTYNSNAIEGNSLTQKETFLIINEGITIKGKPLKDHLEVKDHYEALEYLHEFINKKEQTISESILRTFHGIVTKDTEPEAGKYRTGNVIIAGSAHKSPEAIEVPALMQELIKWIENNFNKLHIIELAAISHHRISNIHPFSDGNGRTARLFMNLLLMQKGFPMVVILKHDRVKYYRTLSKADKGNYSPFLRFIAQAAERSLNIYLKTLKPERSDSKKYLPLSEIAKQTIYSDKYLNLLSRYGKIEAHKDGRNWVTTLDAIKKYQENRERNR